MSTGPTQQLLRRSSVVRSKDAFALIMGNIDGPPATTEPPLSPGRQSGDRPALYLYDDFNEGQPLDYAIDSRDLAQAFTAAGDALDRVHKIETHLRRAYNRPSDRLQRLQRDRLRPPYSNPGALRDPLRNPSSFTPAYRPGDPLPNPGSSPGLSPENPKQQNKPTPCHPLHSQPETGTNSTAASSQPSAPPARLNRRSGAQHLHGRTRFAIAEEGNKAVAQTSGSAPARRQGK
jgi:hypothetical protein